MTFDDLYGALSDVADDYESQVLENLALRAGYLWMCPRLGGGWVNRHDEPVCGECGQPRPEEVKG